MSDTSTQNAAPEGASADIIPLNLPEVRPEPEADPALSRPLLVAVRRATEAVRRETRALKADPTEDLKSFEYGKSQALLDLIRARALVPPAAFSPDLRDELDVFRAALTDNLALLRLHLDAVTEVVGVLSRTMIDFDSDGTYQAPFPERAK